MSGVAETETHSLEASIDALGAMVEGARQMADSGQMVELDVLAMKIAVLTDAVTAQTTDGNGVAGSGARPHPLLPRLEQLVQSLDLLEIALRKRNVNLALDVEQADKRLRAQLAYRSDKPASDKPGR
jgi:hypothetical protein